jgi:hypothetical protein
LLQKSLRKVDNASGDWRNQKFWEGVLPREFVLSACTYSVIKNKKYFAVEVGVFSAYEFVSEMVCCGEELTLRV